MNVGYTPYVVGFARFDLAVPQAFLCGFFLMAVPATTCGAPERLSGSGLPSFSPLWGFAGSLEASIFHFGTVSLYARIFALHCPTPYSAVLSENSPVAIVQLTLVAHLSVCDPFQECMSVQISVLCGCLPGLQGGGRPAWGHSKHVLCTSSRCAARSKPMHPVNLCGGYGCHHRTSLLGATAYYARSSPLVSASCQVTLSCDHWHIPPCGRWVSVGLLLAFITPWGCGS